MRGIIAGIFVIGATGRLGVGLPSSQQVDTHKTTPPSQGPRRDVELKSILDLAAGSPPEFGTDALLRVVESPKVTDRSLKIELLEKAFFLAESVQHPVKLAGIPGSLVDTRSGYLAMAFRLNLDKLSLQSRVVLDLMQLDRVRAVKLFEQIRVPTLRSLACEESLVYDPTSYYQALAHVVTSGSKANDESERTNAVFLRSAVTELSSHAQVSHVAKALTTLNLPSAELEEMASLFAGSLENLQGDERSFAVLATQYDALGALARLVSKLGADGLPSANVLQAARQYVISNLRNSPCRDGSQDERTLLPRAAQDFNDLFGAALAPAKLSPISRDEVQPDHLGAAPSNHPFWQSSPAKELLVSIKKLRFGTGGTPLSVSERETLEWNTQLSDFLTELESWTPTDSEDMEDAFHEKCVLYIGLIDLIPPGQEQSKVIRRYVTFLEVNSFEGTNRIEWLWHVEDLLQRVSAGKEDKGKTVVLEAFRNSRDPTLNLYARLEIWAAEGASTCALVLGDSAGGAPFAFSL
jgi:hypothetical protein